MLCYRHQLIKVNNVLKDFGYKDFHDFTDLLELLCNKNVLLDYWYYVKTNLIEFELISNTHNSEKEFQIIRKALGYSTLAQFNRVLKTLNISYGIVNNLETNSWKLILQFNYSEK